MSHVHTKGATPENICPDNSFRYFVDKSPIGGKCCRQATFLIDQWIDKSTRAL